MTRSRECQRDTGAVAIVVALVTTMLFGMAALAVDLGNTWARRRDAQTQADLAALAGGTLLPKGDAANQTAIATEVANYLNRNKISSDQPTTNATTLTDGNIANGEIGFPKSTQLSVVSPGSRVDFGFATILGISGRSVEADAVVEKRALVPGLDDVLPMWLPASCVYGPVGGDAGPTPSPAVSPEFSPASGNASGNFSVDSKFHITSMSVTTAPYGTTTGSISVTLTNDDAGNIGTATTPVKGAIVFTFGAPTSWAAATTVYPVNLNIPGKSGSTPGSQTVTISGVSSEVTNTVGKWEVWGVRNLSSGKVTPGTSVFTADPKGSNPAEPLKFTVTGGGGEVACNDSQRGNFGQLDSPRTGITQLQRRYEYNVALGLDHGITPFPAAGYPTIATNPECFSDGNPMGALIDNSSARSNNCIYVQSGNDPGGLTAGLLTGVSGGPEGSHPGRLFSAPTSQRCIDNGHVSPAKANSGGIPWSSINRDTLSCFLKPGYTLADVAKDGSTLDILDESITDSPRYFQVPVVYSLDRADKKYIAVKTYASVFLTDESVGPVTPPAKTNATAGNGITMNGGGTQVFAVQLFGFNGFSIYTPPSSPDTEWFEGGKPIIRLVH